MGVWRWDEKGESDGQRVTGNGKMGVGEKEGKGEIGHRELGQGR